MLSVINKVYLTACTDQGNKDYTHTDIRVVYSVIFVTTKADKFSKRKMYCPAYTSEV